MQITYPGVDIVWCHGEGGWEGEEGEGREGGGRGRQRPQHGYGHRLIHHSDLKRENILQELKWETYFQCNKKNLLSEVVESLLTVSVKKQKMLFLTILIIYLKIDKD